MKQFLLGISLLLTMAFSMRDHKKITIWMIGDSTMSVKEKKYYPETGWGMPFAGFWDSTVTVENRARNGRSTKSFIKENLWQPVLDNLQEGDYVFIQFGHNDEVPTKKNATTPAEFKANLEQYVSDTRSKKAIPVLLTSVARRQVDSAGNFADTHKAYAAITAEVAREKGVVLIDVNTSSLRLLQQMGPQASAYLFNQLKPGEHPNYPDGVTDNTHFNEYGARQMAQLVLQEIKDLKLPLAERIVKRFAKK